MKNKKLTRKAAESFIGYSTTYFPDCDNHQYSEDGYISASDVCKFLDQYIEKPSFTKSFIEHFKFFFKYSVHNLVQKIKKVIFK